MCIRDRFGVRLLKNSETYYFLANTSSVKQEYILENYAVIKQSHLNKNNFHQLNNEDYSLLNLEESSNGLFFEPYEIKLVQVNL